MTRVSFIVPAYNEASTIAEVLERVEALDFDKQIVVVDDGSTGDTPRWRDGFKAMFVLLRVRFRD